MDFKNNIPAWSYAKKKKTAQFSDIGMDSEFGELGSPSREAIYRGVINYEVRVPAQPGSPETEQAAADKAASELYQKLWNVVGDQIPDMLPPEKYT